MSTTPRTDAFWQTHPEGFNIAGCLNFARQLETELDSIAKALGIIDSTAGMTEAILVSVIDDQAQLHQTKLALESVNKDVDILEQQAMRLNRLEACYNAEASLSGEQAKEYGQVLYGLCSTNGGQSWSLFNLAHASIENRKKALKQIGAEI